MMWWTRIKACSTASESRLRGEHVHNADLVRYQSLLDGFGVETMTDGGVAVAVSGSIVSKLARRLRSRDISHPRRHAAHRGYQSLLDGFGVETRWAPRWWTRSTRLSPRNRRGNRHRMERARRTLDSLRIGAITISMSGTEPRRRVKACRS
jgi:hypothetical protein